MQQSKNMYYQCSTLAVSWFDIFLKNTSFVLLNALPDCKNEILENFI